MPVVEDIETGQVLPETPAQQIVRRGIGSGRSGIPRSVSIGLGLARDALIDYGSRRVYNMMRNRWQPYPAGYTEPSARQSLLNRFESVASPPAPARRVPTVEESMQDVPRRRKQRMPSSKRPGLVDILRDDLKRQRRGGSSGGSIHIGDDEVCIINCL